MPGWAQLAPGHVEVLGQRAVDPNVAAERFYSTVSDLLELRAIGYEQHSLHTPGLLIPLYDMLGERWGYQYRPDKPRIDRRGAPRKDGSRPERLIKYENPKGQLVRLDIPPSGRQLVKDSEQPLIITEGPIKGDAIASAGYAAVVLLGVTLWHTADWSSLPSLRDRDVYLAFDSDAAEKVEVNQQMAKLAQALRKEHRANVRILAVPPGDTGKAGIDDWLAAGGDIADLIDEATDEVASASPKSPDGRPEIDVTNAALFKEELDELIGRGPLQGIYRRGYYAVHVPRMGEEGYVQEIDPDTGLSKNDEPAQIHRFNADMLRALVSRKMWCYKRTEKSGVATFHPALPNPESCKVAIAGVYINDRIPVLRRVTHTPLVLPNGHILRDPGYHAASGTLYAPDDDLVVPRVPKRPSVRDMEKAISLLDKMLAGFPFATPNDRANYIGALITPLLSAAIPAPRPLLVLSAPQRRSGKTLLAQILMMLYGGTMRPPPSKDQEEVRKSITSILYSTTAPVVVFDNVKGILKSEVLEKLVTEYTWSDRKLSESQEIGMTNDRFWVATSNNAQLGGDLAPRALGVRIDAKTSHPEQREFKLALDAWVPAHRGELLWALLVLVRAWIAAGAPREEFRSDQYQKWGGVVRGILSSASIEGEFFSPKHELVADGGEDDSEWADFLMAIQRWVGIEAFAARDVASAIDTNDDLRENMPGDLMVAWERNRSMSRVIGKWMKNRKDQFAGDLRVVAAGDNGHGITLWKVFGE